MRILIAPDKFKGSCTAGEVCRAMARAAERIFPHAVIDTCPLADGGEGTVDALVQATNGRYEHRAVTGPLPTMQVEAAFGLLGDANTAVIEMASASGIALLEESLRNPMRTTTFGTGELLRHAMQTGVRRIIVGIGGSATVDAGLGMLQAWGSRITLANSTVYVTSSRKLTGADVGNVLRVEPENAMRLARDDDAEPVDRRPAPEQGFLNRTGLQIIVASDVGNPLTGENGAARVFGPQKGASEEQVEQLEAALDQFARRSGFEELAQVPGTGAAGGLGFALHAFLGAQIESGIDIVMRAVDLPARIAQANLVLTGEGMLDQTSLAGKTAIGVARACRASGVPCLAIAGALGPGAEQSHDEGITAMFSTSPRPMTLADSVRDASQLIESTTEQALRCWAGARARS